MTAPFTGMGDAGVNARVVLAYLRMLRHRNGMHDVHAPILIGVAVAQLTGMQFNMMRLGLISLSVAIENGVTSDSWLKDVCYRDLMGYDFRRCFYDAYKGTRRSPRVTNRGARD
jgi:hypothetical protein